MAGKGLQLCVGALLVFAAGYSLAYLQGDSKVERLQELSDSLTTAGQQDSVTANRYADSMATVVTTLQKSKQPITIRISQDSALADSAERAVLRARTAAEVITAQSAQITALKSEVVGLRENAKTDSLSLWVAMARGDSLQAVVNTQTTRLSQLNAQVQELTPRTPAWLRATYKVTALAGAFYAGMKYGEAHP